MVFACTITFTFKFRESGTRSPLRRRYTCARSIPDQVEYPFASGGAVTLASPEVDLLGRFVFAARLVVLYFFCGRKISWTLILADYFLRATGLLADCRSSATLGVYGVSRLFLTAPTSVHPPHKPSSRRFLPLVCGTRLFKIMLTFHTLTVKIRLTRPSEAHF